MSVSLSLCPSLFLSACPVCQSVYLPALLCLCAYVHLSPIKSLSLSLFMCLSQTSFFHVLSLAVYLSSLFSHSSFIFLSLAISVCLSVPFSLSISLSPYLSSIFLSVGNGLWLDLCRPVYSRSLRPLHYFSLYLSLSGYISLSFTLSLSLTFLAPLSITLSSCLSVCLFLLSIFLPPHLSPLILSQPIFIHHLVYSRVG